MSALGEVNRREVFACTHRPGADGTEVEGIGSVSSGDSRNAERGVANDGARRGGDGDLRCGLGRSAAGPGLDDEEKRNLSFVPVWTTPERLEMTSPFAETERVAKVIVLIAVLIVARC